MSKAHMRNYWSRRASTRNCTAASSHKDKCSRSEQRQFAQSNPPIRAFAVIDAKSILITPNGDTVIDFGQNMAGYIRVQIIGFEGMEVTFEHRKTLDEYGNFFCPFPDDHRKQTDIYICSSTATEVFEPKFTYHGFRYVRVKGYTGELNKDQFQAIAISSDNEITGSFHCSNEKLISFSPIYIGVSAPTWSTSSRI